MKKNIGIYRKYRTNGSPVINHLDSTIIKVSHSRIFPPFVNLCLLCQAESISAVIHSILASVPEIKFLHLTLFIK